MREETQQTISDWASATFGVTGSFLRIVVRADEECSELLRKTLTGQDVVTVLEELADIMIILYEFSNRMHHDIESVVVYIESETFHLLAAPISYALMLHRNIDALMALAVEADTGRRAEYLFDEFANHLSLCAQSAVRLAATFEAGRLTSAIQRKMAINRTREWRLDRTGHGYHVQAPSYEFDTQGLHVKAQEDVRFRNITNVMHELIVDGIYTAEDLHGAITLALAEFTKEGS